MDEKSAYQKTSDIAGECVYLLETVLGNMQQIEETGGKGKFKELEDIYKQIEELNLKIISL